jgi:hypothetical protein
MDKSFQVRKQKVLARMRLRRRFAQGKVLRPQFSLAAAAHPDSFKGPLITKRIRDAYDDYED